MTEATTSSDSEAACQARLRRRRLTGLLSVCVLIVAGGIVLADGPLTRHAPETAPPAADVTWHALDATGHEQADDRDQASAVIVRPEIVPLPSAGLGGIALLVVMALWRRANLRLTTRLH